DRGTVCRASASRSPIGGAHCASPRARRTLTVRQSRCPPRDCATLLTLERRLSTALPPRSRATLSRKSSPRGSTCRICRPIALQERHIRQVDEGRGRRGGSGKEGREGEG